MDLTSAQQRLRDEIRRFLERELAPLTSRIDREGFYPMDVVRRMAPLGLLGMAVPRRYGGGGFDAATYALAIEELARICGSTCLSISAHTSLCCAPIRMFGTPAQKKRYLPLLAQGTMLGGFGVTEPGSGSDVRSMTTTAERRGSRYILNGAKRFTTNGGLAGVYVVGAHTVADGEDRGISTFLVEADQKGFSAARAEDKLGVRGSHTTGLFFDGVDVPATRLLGKEGNGFEQLMMTIEAGRIGIGAMAVGIAQAALEVSVAYARRHTVSGQPLTYQQAIQWRLADMATEIEAARLLIRNAARLKDAGRPFRRAASMAKLFASEMSNRATASAVQILGSYGGLAAHPVERYVRDARLTEIGEGTSEIQRIIIAKELFKEADAQTETPGERLMKAMEGIRDEP
jgi:butyryl-CoA dehydrogenase